MDAHAAAPEHDNQGAQPPAIAVVAGFAHHGDDSSTVGGSAG
jgi:hypothetical protein